MKKTKNVLINHTKDDHSKNNNNIPDYTSVWIAIVRLHDLGMISNFSEDEILKALLKLESKGKCAIGIPL